MQQEQSACRDEALLLASLGYSLIPLRPGQKTPYYDLLPKEAGIASWAILGKRPADRNEIRGWFDHDPSCNVGILTGRASLGGLAVLDFDIKTPPVGLFLPPTVVASTGRGLHYYYKTADGLPSHRQPWGDLKAEGGYVVAPPSLHPTGRRYLWADYLSPRDLEVPSDLPTELAEQLQDGEGVARNSTESCDVTECVARNNIIPCYTKFPFIEYAGMDEVAFAVLRLCGRTVDRLGKHFSCPLPGHSDSNPSVALWKPEVPGGIISLHDFHAKANLPQWWPLPDVYAACITGVTRPLSRAERAIWWIRALCDSGFVRKPEVPANSLPPDAPDSASKLYEGFRYLLGLRVLYDPSQPMEAPYSWRFAASWCGIKSQATVSRAMAWLLNRGFITKVVGDSSSSRATTILALGEGA